MLLKKKLKLSTIVLSTILFPQLASANSFFYKNANYSQPLLSMGVNEKVASMSSSVNDQISSIHTDDCLLVFKDSNFRGEWRLFNSSIYDLGSVFFDNMISSAISFGRTTGWSCTYGTLFQHSVSHHWNSGGKTFPLIPNFLITNLKSIDFNDQISSVIVPSGYCLKAWHDAPSNTVINSPALLQTWQNNPDVTFYSTTFVGPIQYPDAHVYTGGEHSDVPNVWNDKLSAVLLTQCW